MLLFSNLKKYLLEGNIYFNNIIHHTNNIVTYSSFCSPNYVLDLPAVIGYYVNGQISRKIWYINGNKHREGDLPAEIEYHQNGKLDREIWYKNGKHITVIYYNENGQPKAQYWYKNYKWYGEEDFPKL